ncbi:hypothetical protein BH23ACT9_BH23ACT9_27760 [soil metagenome]
MSGTETHFADVAELPCDPSAALVCEHGWQSWSPAGVHRATATSPRLAAELLARSDVTRVVVAGGTAAISPPVLEQIRSQVRSS